MANQILAVYFKENGQRTISFKRIYLLPVIPFGLKQSGEHDPIHAIASQIPHGSGSDRFVGMQIDRIDQRSEKENNNMVHTHTST